MTFDDWCANHGIYLNDNDDAARAARLMARHAWDAAMAESAKLCEQATTAKELAMRAALADMLAGWRYIRQSHGDLYGVGWDRAQGKAEAALGLQPGQEMPAEWFVGANAEFSGERSESA